MVIQGCGRSKTHPLLQHDLCTQDLAQTCTEMVPSLPMSPRRGQTLCHFISSVHMERYSTAGTGKLQEMQELSKVQEKKYQIWTSTSKGGRIHSPMEHSMCGSNWTLFIKGQGQNDQWRTRGTRDQSAMHDIH